MNPITTRRRARLMGMIAAQVAATEPAGAARLEVTALRPRVTGIRLGSSSSYHGRAS
jgi:hypothetical protein